MASAKEAIPFVRAALDWALAVDKAHQAVVSLFPRREHGIVVQMPKPKVTGTRLVDLGTSRLRVPEFEPVRQAHGHVERRILSFQIASDVIEPVPVRYEESLLSALPPALTRYEFKDRRVDIYVNCEFDHADTAWHDIRQTFAVAWFVMRAKSLGLVAWVRRRVAEMNNATLPEISWKAHKPKGGQTIEVSLAGARRLVDLTRSEHSLLANLARGKIACSRMTKSELTQKVPELSPYIGSVGAAPKGQTYYQVPTEIASLIRVTPAR